MYNSQQVADRRQSADLPDEAVSQPVI